jgi:hypothetical protein
MNQLQTELMIKSDYEEKISELEKINKELKNNLNETKAVINDMKYKQLNINDDIIE